MLVNGCGKQLLVHSRKSTENMLLIELDESPVFPQESLGTESFNSNRMTVISCTETTVLWWFIMIKSLLDIYLSPSFYIWTIILSTGLVNNWCTQNSPQDLHASLWYRHCTPAKLPCYVISCFFLLSRKNVSNILSLNSSMNFGTTLQFEKRRHFDKIHRRTCMPLYGHCNIKVTSQTTMLLVHFLTDALLLSAKQKHFKQYIFLLKQLYEVRP